MRGCILRKREDRGMVIIVINHDDFQQVVKGVSGFGDIQKEVKKNLMNP